jgi:sulfopyruvate decarboxylase subunit alpha
MISGTQIEQTLQQLGITHVVWLPDSAIGQWEDALEQSQEVRLVRVCREGEAWAVAAGLYLGGQRPLVMIQNTGLLESGDALRNVLFDMKLPLYSIIGYRSYLVENSPDTARKFTEPILAAWGLDYVLLKGDEPLRQLVEHFRACQAASRPGVALLPEGRP